MKLTNFKSTLSFICMMVAASVLTPAVSYGAAYSYYLRPAVGNNLNDWYRIPNKASNLTPLSPLSNLNDDYLDSKIFLSRGYDGNTYVGLPGDFINSGNDLFILRLQQYEKDFAFPSKNEAQEFCNTLINIAHENRTVGSQAERSVFVSNWDGYFPRAIGVAYFPYKSSTDSLLLPTKRYFVCPNPVKRKQNLKNDDENDSKGLIASTEPNLNGYQTYRTYEIICASGASNKFISYLDQYHPYNWSSLDPYDKHLYPNVKYIKGELDANLGVVYCRNH